MKFLHSEIGSAKDNIKSPIHNWYKFTAGFSHKFVDEIIKKEKLAGNKKARIFDPFAGCGTTLVSAQKHQLKSVGNEGQEFMFDIIRAKLNWRVNELEFEKHLAEIRNYVAKNRSSINLTSHAHPLLLSLYKPNTLKTLYLLRDAIANIKSHKYKLFFKLALSQTLHKVSIFPIAVPYISRNRVLANNHTSLTTFITISKKMYKDCKEQNGMKKTSLIFLQDSRTPNKKIKNNSCSVCISSPPYLNNLDYGEVSKVHTHFFEVTQSWNDITNQVRKKLVTGATTHYKDSEFTIKEFKATSFYRKNKKIADSLIKRSNKLEVISKLRLGKKSFAILMLLYFQDMYKVLLEIRRVLRPEGKAYLILGDSAPYGMLVPTTRILGEIAKNIGFNSFKIYKIRSRGTKWKDLTYRHNLELSENLLILK